MSEFKFSCPNCQQNIQATSEYSGHEVQCPSCHATLVVPASPDAPAAPIVPAVPAAHAPRLSVAASAPQVQEGASAAAAMYSRTLVKKKKSKVGLIVGCSLGVVAIAAAAIFWKPLMQKVSKDNQAAAAAVAQTPTNEVAQPPPELTTEEVLQKVAETYSGLTDYAAKGDTIADMDFSAVNPAIRTLNMKTTSTLQLGRTNNYRLEWEQSSPGKTTKGAAWSSGKGNFVGYGAIPPNKAKTREAALAPTYELFYLLSKGVADLFFGDIQNVSAEARNFTRTNGPALPGQDCYVLMGEAYHQNLLLWVDKSTFLIAQIQVTFGATTPEDELKKLPRQQQIALKAMAKIKGSVTETYSSIQTNKNLLASAFESPYQPSGSAGGAPTRTRAGSMAGQLTNPRRQRGQTQN